MIIGNVAGPIRSKAWPMMSGMIISPAAEPTIMMDADRPLRGIYLSSIVNVDGNTLARLSPNRPVVSHTTNSFAENQ